MSNAEQTKSVLLLALMEKSIHAPRDASWVNYPVSQGIRELVLVKGSLKKLTFDIFKPP